MIAHGAMGKGQHAMGCGGGVWWCVDMYVVRSKVHTVPEETETDPQFGGPRPGLGPEARSRAGDWMGLGLGSTGQRPGLGLESQAKGQD